MSSYLADYSSKMCSWSYLGNLLNFIIERSLDKTFPQFFTYHFYFHFHQGSRLLPTCMLVNPNPAFSWIESPRHLIDIFITVLGILHCSYVFPSTCKLPRMGNKLCLSQLASCLMPVREENFLNTLL